MQTTETADSFLEGFISVMAALRGANRTFRKIYVDRDIFPQRGMQLRAAAEKAGAPLEYRKRSAIDSLVEGRSHGGVVAAVGPRRFVAIDELLAVGEEPAFIVMLDGVEDPFSFGQIIRALYAAGAHGLVVRPRNWTTATATVARASAGTSELMPTAVAETPEEAARFFKEHKLSIATLARRSEARSIYDADFKQALFLLLGGEKRGVQRSFLAQADLLLEIPYGRPFRQSLGTVAAAAALGFEVLRQRRKGGGPDGRLS